MSDISVDVRTYGDGDFLELVFLEKGDDFNGGARVAFPHVYERTTVPQAIDRLIDSLESAKIDFAKVKGVVK